MKFAILKCSGSGGSGLYVPNGNLIEKILGPYFAKHGWQLTGLFARIEGTAALVGLKGCDPAKDIFETITNFHRFLWETQKAGGKDFPQEFRDEFTFLVYLTSGIEVIVLCESTEQDGDIFSAFVLNNLLSAIPKAIETVNDEMTRLAEKFKEF